MNVMNKCIKCGIESKAKFCSDKCRKADYRDRLGQSGTNNNNENGTNVPKVGQIESGTKEVGQPEQRAKPDDILSMSIEDIIRLPLDKAKAILRSWAMGTGNIKQYMLGNLAIEHDVTQYHYPVSHLINRKTNQNQI